MWPACTNRAVDVGCGREAHAPVDALDQGQRAFRVGRGEERQGRIVAARPVPVGEARLFLLQMRRVRQQDLEQIARCRPCSTRDRGSRPGRGAAGSPSDRRARGSGRRRRACGDRGAARAQLRRRRALSPWKSPQSSSSRRPRCSRRCLEPVTVPPAAPRKVRVAPEIISTEVYRAPPDRASVGSSGGAAMPHRGGRIPGPP